MRKRSTRSRADSTATGTALVTEVPHSGTSVSDSIRLSLGTSLQDALRESARSPNSATLRSILVALEADALDEALRRVDRAWRYTPEDSATIAPIYGRLLVLQGKDFNAALSILRYSADLSPDPDIAAMTIHALWRMRRIEEAGREFVRALAGYCVEPGGLLTLVGRELLGDGEINAAGWLGRGPRLDLVGQLAANEPNSLEISIDGGTPFTQMLPNLSRDGVRDFSFAQPQPGVPIRLDVSSHGRSLLGSGAEIHADFNLDGRSQNRGRQVTGWARVGWRPSQPVTLRIEDETGSTAQAHSRRIAGPAWHWSFAIDLVKSKLTGQRITISAQLPDGRWHPLPDAPLLLEPALFKGSKPAALVKWEGVPPRRARLRTIKRAKMTDIIIPVYRGRQETLRCIASVLATKPDYARLVVIDDASDDPALSVALEELEATGDIQLLRNSHNQGFVASVNRGLGLHSTHDVVALNSDTLVFGDWLERLREAAYSGPSVGTVTPLSNSGSIASYPRMSGNVMDTETAAALHALAASTLSATRAEIPVGVGFCLYIRRDCLRDNGYLDEAAFAKGYGEETDFCLRARRRGWSHQLAADVFVYHAEGTSFGSRRRALLDRSQRVLNLRHPGFDGFIAKYLAVNTVQPLRRRLDERRLLAFDGRFVLIVSLALPGGVETYVTERARALRAQGSYALVLRPVTAGKSDRCELWTDALDVPNLQFDVPRDLAALTGLLRDLSLTGIEIQHFLNLDPRLIEAVRALGVPYDVMVHDYSWICPRVTLIDGSNRYCGEPEVSVCQTCVRRHGSKLGEKISVTALRARSSTWLEGARRVTAPSQDTAGRLRRYFPNLDVGVQPHTEGLPTPASRPRNRVRALFRIALIGAIGTHKGYRMLLECARDARARKLPMEFVVIGHTENDAPLLATGKVFVTGRYSEAEAPHLIEREQPDIAWLPSVWPETWCYALDHALRAQLPIVAFDIGAVAERLRSLGTGELMPLKLAAPRINDRFLDMSNRPNQVNFTKHKSLEKISETLVPPARDDATMLQSQTHGMYMAKALNGGISAAVKDDGLSASVQVLPLPTGLYLFSVKAARAPLPSTNGQLSLPAMHIGLGPGVRADQVDFIAGPSTHGAWLFSSGDVLVTKVNANGATLVLTSVRAPGGEVLSIAVERLEDRIDAAMAGLPAPVPAAAKTKHPNGAAPAPAKIAKPVFAKTGNDLPLPLQIGAHIRSRGDMMFANVPWAGRVAPGLWIESFAVRPMEHFGAQDIEYKGLTGSGFETPWISDNAMCGTKGMATPLVGFAIRLKPSPAAAAFDCEYSGYYQSGTTVGPLRNGAPCRSSVANDSLEGIQVRIVRRITAHLPEANPKAHSADHGHSKNGARAKPAVTRSTAKRPAAAAAKTKSAVSKSSSAKLTKNSGSAGHRSDAHPARTGHRQTSRRP